MSVESYYSDNVRSKARRVPSHAIQQSEHDESVWLVTSSRTGKKVRVQFIYDDHGDVEWRTCTCTNGNKRGGQTECYHAAAAETERERRKGDEKDGVQRDSGGQGRG